MYSRDKRVFRHVPAHGGFAVFGRNLYHGRNVIAKEQEKDSKSCQKRISLQSCFHENITTYNRITVI